MVGGLDRFRDHFSRHLHQYALIGGSACDLLMEQAGLTFRATKDLDIVLIAETLDSGFARRFWDFVREGRYELAQTGEGVPARYRFVAPRTAGFPAMLEILSVRPYGLGPADGVHLSRVRFDDGVSSLSAILLQEEYYRFLRTGVRQAEGVSVVGAEHLLPMKARAWLDLKERRAAGHVVQSGDINKHRRDAFRLYRIIDPAPLNDVPPLIRSDMSRFLSGCRTEPMDLKGLASSTVRLTTCFPSSGGFMAYLREALALPLPG